MELESLFEEVNNDPDLRAFFRSQENGGESLWMTSEQRLSDGVLNHFEKMLSAMDRWAKDKGMQQAFAMPDMAAIPNNVALAVMRELQLRRAMEAMQETETLNL